MRRSAAVSLVLVVMAALVAPGAPVAALSDHHVGATTYQNSLDLQLPGGQQVASCADPDVIRAHDATDKHWYLYCTSDALTEDEFNSTGDLVIHNVPMFSSTDLVHWSYRGDAFPVKPSLVAATGNIWAPEITFANGQYLLYYAASDTTVDGGSSAIGVATSDSPIGPWTDAASPVVEPASGGQWRYDPEVIDYQGKSYLYFGSYFGGIFARELSDDGLTSLPQSQQQIAIDNRYEGTNIVQHDGWFYFMGSAANCCNGPLTGYSVFAARSQSPFGPFVDRAGVSILDSQVGGTPVLRQNGNRWVGTGHNTVFTDFGGQDWTIYHAVDRTDPYYAGSDSYTKRPALMDPLDWQLGWPTVRGGQGPSDQPMPRPAAQRTQHTAYQPRFLPDLRLVLRILPLSDEFSRTELSSRWSWVREPAADQWSLAGGRLNLQTQAADLHPESATPLASVLTEAAPSGDYLVETKLSISTPPGGCCQNYVQGGLVIYGDDGNYLKLASVSIWNTRQSEFGKEVTPVPAGQPNYGNAVGGPVAAETWLRIEHRQIGKEDRYTAYTSIDGQHWDRGATWAHRLGAGARIGLVSMGGAGFETDFDYVRVSTLR